MTNNRRGRTSFWICGLIGIVAIGVLFRAANDADRRLGDGPRVTLPVFSRSLMPFDDLDAEWLRRLTLREDGTYWAGRDLMEAELLSGVGEIAATMERRDGLPDDLLLVSADGRAKWAKMERVYEACRHPSAGIWKVSLMVRTSAMAEDGDGGIWTYLTIGGTPTWVGGRVAGRVEVTLHTDGGALVREIDGREHTVDDTAAEALLATGECRVRILPDADGTVQDVVRVIERYVDLLGHDPVYLGSIGVGIAVE